MDFFENYLPLLPRLFSAYQTTYSPYIAPVYRSLLLAQSFLYRYVFPLVFPLYALANKALHILSSDSPDLLSLLALGVILLITLRILDYMRKTLIFWISLILRASFYLALAGIGLYVWQRGLEQSVEDFGWAWGIMQGLNDEGQRFGRERADSRKRDAQRVRSGQTGRRGRTRGAGW